MYQAGDMAMESIIATPENSGLADSDEDLTGTGFTDTSSTVAQVSPPAEFQDPSPPGTGPPTAVTAIWPVNSDTQTRVPRRKRRGRPPLLVGQESSEATIAQPGTPPKQAPDNLSGPAPAVPHPASSSSYVPPAMLQPASSSLAPVVARSVSPTRDKHLMGASPVPPLSTELPPPPLPRPTVPRPEGDVPAVLKMSGSAPSLPPLPPLLAVSGPSREKIPRSRSVVALHDSRGTHGEVNQVLQRPAPQHFRTAPIKNSSEDFRHQQDCGPSGVGTGSLPLPQPQPPQPQRQTSELGLARLAPKLPTALVGQQAGRSKVSSRSDQVFEDVLAAGRLAAWSPERARELSVQDGPAPQRQWRELGPLGQGRGVHEGWAEAAAREADARLSVV